MKLNLVFPPIIAGVGYILKLFVTSPIVESTLKSLPFAVDKIPFIVAAAFPPLIFISGIVPAMGLAALETGGYDNQHPRMMRSATGAIQKYPTLFRMQSAHQNTIECAAMMTPAFWVASTLGLDNLLFAKLASLVLLARVAYFPAYGIGLDALRTCLFALAFFSITAIAFAPIFPNTILPLLGQGLPKLTN